MSKYLFLDKWFVDSDDSSAMEKHIDWFLDQFPINMQQIILKLLDKYEFYDEYLQNKLFENYKNKIKEYIVKNNISNYVITMPFENGPHNSYYILSIFKSFNFGAEGFLTPCISDDDFCKYKNIIFIDDYSGSGSTFIDFYKRKSGLIASKAKVFFFPCFMTELARDKIFNSEIGNSVILSNDVSILRKAKFIEEQGVLDSGETDQLIDYSTNFIKIRPCLVRGYENTEDLFSLFNMTPNNTIALFWWINNTLYYPLFKRNTAGQRSSLKHPRFKYSFIKEYNDSLYSNASGKMKTYLIIAVLLFIGNSLLDIAEQCDFENFSLKEGVKFLKNKKVLDEALKISIPSIKSYIDLDRIIIFIKTGIAYSNYSTIKRNLIRNIKN